MGPRSRREDPETACRVLAHFIETCKTPDDPKLELWLCDFLWNLRLVRPEAALGLQRQILSRFLPKMATGLMRQLESKERNVRASARFGLLTVKRTELEAAAIAFDIDLTKPEFLRADGRRYYESFLLCPRLGGSQRLILSMVGEDRQVNAALAVRAFFDQFDVDLFILLGVAAGLQTHTNLGDVVCATSVVDVEGGRLEKLRPLFRPVHANITKHLKRDLEHFDPYRVGWADALTKGVAAFDRSRYDIPTATAKWRPKFSTAHLASGEKLIVDDSLPDTRVAFGEQIRAREMEAAGFCSACEDIPRPWMVFRGVADFGTAESKDQPTKDGEDRKAWQAPAALAAATACRLFLTTEYAIDGEVSF